MGCPSVISYGAALARPEDTPGISLGQFRLCRDCLPMRSKDRTVVISVSAGRPQPASARRSKTLFVDVDLCSLFVLMLSDDASSVGASVMRYGEIDGMSRKVEGILLGFGILAAVTVILAGADAGSASHCAVPLPKWVGCVLALHEGLAGGLIGAGGTIFAGWLAWSGVREQIQSERELSTAAERGNLGAILAEMGELFDVFNEVWRAIDLDQIPVRFEHSRHGGRSWRIPAL